MSNQKVLELLRKKLNQEVSLIMHTETRDKELGNMNPTSKPQTVDGEYLILLLGVYGINGTPLYAHGKEGGVEKLYRNNMHSWVDEDTGNPFFESSVEITKIGGIDTRGLFSYGFGESELRARIEAKEDDAEGLAKRIVTGRKPKDFPGQWVSSPCTFDDEVFISKVKAYLDKIV